MLTRRRRAFGSAAGRARGRPAGHPCPFGQSGPFRAPIGHNMATSAPPPRRPVCVTPYRHRIDFMGYPFATAALGPLLFAQGATCAASRRGCPSRRPTRRRGGRRPAAARAGGRRFGRRGRRRRDAARRAVRATGERARGHPSRELEAARAHRPDHAGAGRLARRRAGRAVRRGRHVARRQRRDGRRAAGPLAGAAGRARPVARRALPGRARDPVGGAANGAFRRCRSRSRGISGCARSGSTRHSPGGPPRSRTARSCAWSCRSSAT